MPSIPDAGDVRVPCGKCKLCCQGNTLVALVPERGDDIAQYETVAYGEFIGLKLKPNGDCWYLGESGCTIHGNAPYMCRIYDCRAQHAYYDKRTRENLIKQGVLNKATMRQGAILIHQHEKAIAAGKRAFEIELKKAVQEEADNANRSRPPAKL